MPPDGEATTWGLEADAAFTLSETAWDPEAAPCLLPKAQLLVFAAFTDGTNWADLDGTEWGWTDFPPAEVF